MAALDVVSVVNLESRVRARSNVKAWALFQSFMFAIPDPKDCLTRLFMKNGVKSPLPRRANNPLSNMVHLIEDSIACARQFFGSGARAICGRMLLSILLWGAPIFNASAASVDFTLSNANPNPNDQFTVPLKTARFTGITSFSFSLQWDPNVIQFLGLGSSFGVSSSELQFNTNSTVLDVGRMSVIY